MTNDPADLQILHEIVCRDYTKLRTEGGRADSPYLPLLTLVRRNFFVEATG